MTIYENDRGTRWYVVQWYHHVFGIRCKSKKGKGRWTPIVRFDEHSAQDALNEIAHIKGWKKVEESHEEGR